MAPVAETPVRVVLALAETAAVPRVPVAETPVRIMFALPTNVRVPRAPVAPTPETGTDIDPPATTETEEILPLADTPVRVTLALAETVAAVLVSQNATSQRDVSQMPALLAPVA
jgi:hypothetical protein